ncbi:M48 family metalloprotease [bacterium]|nr:M48 family metalloprotease [bacterium]
MNRKQLDQIYLPSKNGYTVINTDGIRGNNRSQRTQSELNLNWFWYKIKNHFQFSLMLISMVSILGYIGYAIAGTLGVLSTMIAIGISIFVRSGFKIEQILAKKNVRLIRPFEGTTLYDLLERLIRKAGLEKKPYLFLDYSPEINAYTIEDNEKSAIIVSKGLLENLNQRELNGVLAHEVAHLKNRDVRIMLFTDQIRNLTAYMAFFGQILLLFSIPFLVVNQMVIPWIAILLLILSPTVNLLFHVALSRNREFRADLDAIALSGDAMGLAMALKKINIQMSLWKKLYASYLKNVPEIMRTHPNTRARIALLEKLDVLEKRELTWL